jgi:hypothetical protein
MSDLTDSTPTPVEQALTDAAIALERGEFIEGIPKLQPPLLYPIHPLFEAYQRALRAAYPLNHPHFTLDEHGQRTPSPEFKGKTRAELAVMTTQAFNHWQFAKDYLKLLEQRRRTDAFSGGLRRLADAEWRMKRRQAHWDEVRWHREHVSPKANRQMIRRRATSLAQATLEVIRSRQNGQA